MFEQIAGWVIWGAMAIGYVAMLALTERSAAHFVAGPHEVRDSSAIVIINGAVPVGEPAVAHAAPFTTRTRPSFE